jgi:hypothetical protein
MVAAYLDRRLPQAAKGEPFTLSFSHAPLVGGLLRYLDALPPELITLQGEALEQYIESVEALRGAVEAWTRGDQNRVLEKLPDGQNTNPLVYIRKHWERCRTRLFRLKQVICRL